MAVILWRLDPTQLSIGAGGRIAGISFAVAVALAGGVAAVLSSPAPRGSSPWQDDGPWPNQPMLSEQRHSVGGMIAVVFVCMGAALGLGWWAWLARAQDAVGVIGLVMFSLLFAGGAGRGCYLILRWIRFAPSIIAFPQAAWPLAPGMTCRFRLRGPALPVDGAQALRADAVFVQERLVHVSGRGRTRTRTEVDILARAGVRLVRAEQLGRGVDMEWEIALPAGTVQASLETMRGPGTIASGMRKSDGTYQMGGKQGDFEETCLVSAMSGVPPRYWLLTMSADLPGLDWAAEWYLPVYPRPS